MADLSQHTNYTAAYSGLLNNFYLTLAIAGACLIGHEIEVRVPRRRGRDGPRKIIPVRVFNAAVQKWALWNKPKVQHPHRTSGRLSSEALVEGDGDRSKDAERERVGGREAWEFGYIFQPKTWAVNASRPVPKWPLMWIGAALKFRERDMPATCGLDLTLHARFLRGCFFYTLLQTLIIMPILMPLHIFYSSKDIASTSMLRSSISSLVSSSGSKWLWVHAVLIWWVSITWTCTVLWITWGAVAYRKREVRALSAKIAKQREIKRETSRGEEGEDAFTIGEDSEGIKRFRTIMVLNIPPDMRDQEVLTNYFDYYIRRHHARKKSATKRPFGQRIRQVLPIGNNPSYKVEIQETEGSHVEEVVLVRKLTKIVDLRSRREDVLKKLEIAHTVLAKRVLAEVKKYYKKPKLLNSINDAEKHLRMSVLVENLGRFTLEHSPEEGTVWDALHAVPKKFLLPYQPLTHSFPFSFFKKTNPPLIDYLTTKLNYLTLLLSQAQASPLSSYTSASTAFVTFNDAKTARLALKILDSHPKRTLACKAVPAPDWTDLLWERLSKSTYRADFVKKWAVYLGVWAFTLVWIFPVSLLCALASLSNIAGFIKPLQNFLNEHAKVASVITSLAPVILVALLTLAICPILLVIANKAETIVTRVGIHNSVLERFWKFLMVNGVVFFAIGQSTIEAYLTAFQSSDFDPLPIIASAFPTAAPYFASYILLQVAIQPFFEIFRFGLPTIVYVFGTRRSVIPRQRKSRTAHPTFSHFSQLPQQLLGGAIMHLFSLLNPLVIAFTLVYYGACYVVWKRQFVYVYGRLYEVNGRRSSIRILRYSLDALVLAQFVLFAFFILNTAKGHAAATGVLFCLTLVQKLVITRALKKRFDKLEHDEADILCPPVVSRLNPRPDGNVSDSSSAFSDDLREDLDDAKSVGTSKYKTMKRDFEHWTKSWSNRHRSVFLRGAIGKTLFETLDAKIQFEPSAMTETPLDDYLQPSVTPEPTATAGLMIVVPHPPLPPWEDIPPYHRMRGYNDQPAYTDGYDRFLLLQRDPRSVVDLDDCVEMRLALTSPDGGDGNITDSPLGCGGEGGEDADDEEEKERPSPLRSRTEPMSAHDMSSYDSRSGLLANRSDVWGGGASSLMRRHTEKTAGNLSSLFKPLQPLATDPESAISMDTFSVVSTEVTRTESHNVQGMTSEEVMEETLHHTTDTDAESQQVLGPPGIARKGSRVSFVSNLGRSPSRRRPSRPPPLSTAGNPSMLSPRLGRSASAYSSRDRTPSSMSAQQQALLDEVMREERQASEDVNKEEMEEMEKEQEEMKKEEEKRRKASADEGSSGLKRRRTRAGTILTLSSARSDGRLGSETGDSTKHPSTKQTP